MDTTGLLVVLMGVDMADMGKVDWVAVGTEERELGRMGQLVIGVRAVVVLVVADKEGTGTVVESRVHLAGLGDRGTSRQRRGSSKRQLDSIQ